VSTPRFIRLAGGPNEVIFDMAPSGGRLPRILHFGARLEGTDPEALVAAEPQVLWGARMDAPRGTSVLPGTEAGHFGLAAMEPGFENCWSVEGATHAGDHLKIRLRVKADEGSALLELTYRMHMQGVLAARVTVVSGDDRLVSRIRQITSLALSLPCDAYEILTFGGDWAREFREHRQRVGSGSHVIESRRGRGGHDGFPGLFAGTPGFSDCHGAVHAFTLGWSGSHRMTVERTREGQIVLHGRALLDEADRIDAGYSTPWCYAAHSAHGLNGVAQMLHEFIKGEILPGDVTATPRPVHYNTWEAVYFDHKLETLKGLADKAASVGAERFVLDDGWFKGRANDTAGLGDWECDPGKYPAGLAPLAAHVSGLGMTFGLWVEPEMVNPDSDLARQHPDWIRTDAGSTALQRHQAVLDLSRTDVRDHLFAMLHAQLSACDISYLKWDMNRDLTGTGHKAQVEGLHALIDRLRAVHPRVEIETCASGGGRCDFGMLARTERVWVSDTNDALDRLDIQRNANLFLPLAIAGVHVGPATCHITGRRLGMDLRAHVALFGHMGLELDLREVEERDLARLAQHIQTYKAHRALLHGGRYWRVPLADGDHVAQGVTATDGREGLFLVVRTGSRELGRGALVRLPGLEAGLQYRVAAPGPLSRSVEGTLAPSLRDGKLLMNGCALASRGLDLFLPRPETSLLLHVKAV
jgi:alpha-galactosidase